MNELASYSEASGALAMIQVLLYIATLSIILFGGKYISRWWTRLEVRERQLGEIIDLLKYQIEKQGHPPLLNRTEKQLLDALRRKDTSTARSKFNELITRNQFFPQEIQKLLDETK